MLDAKFATLYDMISKKPRTFGERIAQLLRETGMSQTALAKAAKVKKQAVSEWLSGRSKSAAAEILFEIEDATGYSARWLATGEGEPKLKKLDPTDTVILSNVEKLSPTGKNAVQAFVEFELNRRT